MNTNVRKKKSCHFYVDIINPNAKCIQQFAIFATNFQNGGEDGNFTMGQGSSNFIVQVICQGCSIQFLELVLIKICIYRNSQYTENINSYAEVKSALNFLTELLNLKIFDRF